MVHSRSRYEERYGREISTVFKVPLQWVHKDAISTRTMFFQPEEIQNVTFEVSARINMAIPKSKRNWRIVHVTPTVPFPPLSNREARSVRDMLKEVLEPMVHPYRIVNFGFEMLVGVGPDSTQGFDAPIAGRQRVRR